VRSSSPRALKRSAALGQESAVREQVNALFEDLGDAGHAAYRSDPLWLSVQEAARDAPLVIEPPTAPPG
jgi:hypothetical protein